MSQRFDDFDSFSKITLPKSVQNMPRCDWCNKPLPKRHVIHKNICQDSTEHKFCCRTCKENWCHDNKS